MGGNGDTTTLAHLEGPYMYADAWEIRRVQTYPENSENRSKMRRFTTHSHTYLYNLQDEIQVKISAAYGKQTTKKVDNKL